PTLFWREGERLYWHGSSASRMLRSQAGGIPVCLTVAHMDALILARSAFRHSMNYRAVMVFGTAAMVADPREKEAGFNAFIDRLYPGRTGIMRDILPEEIKATSLMSMGIDEVSAKIRSASAHRSRTRSRRRAPRPDRRSAISPKARRSTGFCCRSHKGRDADGQVPAAAVAGRRARLAAAGRPALVGGVCRRRPRNPPLRAERPRSADPARPRRALHRRGRDRKIPGRRPRRRFRAGRAPLRRRAPDPPVRGILRRFRGVGRVLRAGEMSGPNALGQPVGDPVPGWSPRETPARTAMAGRFCRVEALAPDRHAADLFAANSEDRDGRMWTYLPFGPYASFAEYLDYAKAAAVSETRLTYAIVTDKAVGV